MQITEVAAAGSQIEEAQVITKFGIADEQDLSIPTAIQGQKTARDTVESIVVRLQQLDESAEFLFGKLLDAVNVTLDRDTGEVIRDKKGSMLFNFGVPDLLFRLEYQQSRERKLNARAPQDAIARARIWHHVAEACKPGDSVPDVTEDWQLNGWLPEDHPKFNRTAIYRNCESCGMPWDVCVGHFQIVVKPVDGSAALQQDDARKAWLCSWCYDMPVVHRQFDIERKIARPKERKHRGPNRSYLERLQIGGRPQISA